MSASRHIALWGRRVVVWGVLGLLFAYGALWAAVALIDPDSYRATIEKRLGGLVQGAVTIQEMEWRLRGLHLQVDARGATLTRQQAPELVADVQRISAEVALPALLFGRLQIRRLGVDEPTVTVHRLDTAATGAAGLVQRPPIGMLRVVNGRVVFANLGDGPPPVVLLVENLSVVGIDGDGPIRFDMHAKDTASRGFGALELNARWEPTASPSLTVSGRINELHGEAFAKQFPGVGWLTAATGPGTIVGQYRGDPRGYGSASVTLDAGRMQLSHSQWWTAPVVLGDATVAATMQTAPGTITVSSLELQKGELRWMAAGEVNWTDAPVIRNLTMEGRLRFDQLRDVVPWRVTGSHARWFQDVMASGGTLVVNRAHIPTISFDTHEGGAVLDWNHASLNARLEDVHILAWPDPSWPGVQIQEAQFGLADGTISVPELHWQIDRRRAPSVSGHWQMSETGSPITLRLDGALDLTLAAWPVVADALARLGISDVGGVADVNLQASLPPHALPRSRVRGRVRLQNAQWLGHWGGGFQLANVNGTVTLSDSMIRADPLKARFRPLLDKNIPYADLQLSGHVDRLRTAPRLTLDRLSTSGIPLKWVADQWEPADGGIGQWLHSVFSQGGSARVADLATRDLPLTTWSKASWGAIQGDAAATGITIPLDAQWPALTELAARVRLGRGKFDITGDHARLDGIRLDDLHAATSDLTVSGVRVTISAAGDFDAPEKAPSRILSPVGFGYVWGSARVETQISYSGKTEHPWQVRGRAAITDLHAKDNYTGAVLSDVTGGIGIVDGHQLQIELTDLAGRVNDVPVRTAGDIVRDEFGIQSVDVELFADGLALGAIAGWHPETAEMALSGRLTADGRLKWLREDSARVFWSGQAGIEDVEWSSPDGNQTIRDGRMALTGDGTTTAVTVPSLTLNGQSVTASARIQASAAPHLDLAVMSADLDVDRLWDALAPSLRSGAADASAGLPDLLANCTATLDLSAPKGRFQGQAFTNMKAAVDYEFGAVPRWSVDAAFGSGRIRGHGNADLRSLPKGIDFTATPRIERMPAATVAHLVGQTPWSLEGPISITGWMGGRFGAAWRQELMGRLNGRIDAGKITDIKATATFWNKILTVFSLKGLFTGGTFRQLDKSGLLFDGVDAHGVIKDGNLTLERFRFDGKTVFITANGTIIDLEEETVDGRAKVVVAESLYFFFKAIPLIGKAGQELTGVEYRITGPLTDPTVEPPRVTIDPNDPFIESGK